MGEHASQSDSTWRAVAGWAWSHRRKILAGVAVALPLVARYVPGFPDGALLDVLRVYLGA